MVKVQGILLVAPSVHLHAFEKTGADAEEDEQANRASICILDNKQQEGAIRKGGDENGDSGTGSRSLSIDPFNIANRLCNV